MFFCLKERKILRVGEKVPTDVEGDTMCVRGNLDDY